MLTVQTFMWLLRAGVLTYSRSFDHQGATYAVQAGPAVIPVDPSFMPERLDAGRDQHAQERWDSIRDLRIAQALDRIAKAGALNAHTTLWLHARVAEIIDRATPRSA